MARDIYLVNLNDLTQLQVQTVPGMLEVKPSSSWEAVASPGRNSPFFHFSGSEESVTLELDWYAVEEHKMDVLKKCRWVKSLSMADGYLDGPPLIKLIFGYVFPPTVRWRVVSAPYELSLFDASKGMYPCQAYQTIELKRVADHNLSTYEIRNDIDLNLQTI